MAAVIDKKALKTCVRQNSANEIKENNTKQPDYLRQNSKCALMSQGNKIDTVSVKIQEEIDYSSKESGLSDQSYNKGKRRLCNRIWKMIALCSCLASMISMAGLALLYFGILQVGFTEKIQNVPGIGTSMAGTQVIEPSFSGSFSLDQDYLKEHKEVRWRNDDESSKIQPSSNDSCLRVSLGGKYIVNSRFTVNIPPVLETESQSSSDDDPIIHTIRVLSTDGETLAFRRQYLTIVEHKLQADSELRKPSVFSEFFSLNACDRVCATISQPELLYGSPVDNNVNIVKVP